MLSCIFKARSNKEPTLKYVFFLSEASILSSFGEKETVNVI